MANVFPISALRPASTEPIPIGRLNDAPDAAALVERWRADGVLESDGPASAYIVEVTLRQSRQPPVRWVMCGLRADGGTLELEVTSHRPSRTGPTAVLGVAEDDQRVLSDQLTALTQDRSADFETVDGENRVRVWRVPSGAEWKRLESYLEEVRLRPLAPLPAEGGCLVAIASLSEPGLRIEPIHRAIREVETFHPERFLPVVSGYARIYDLDLPLNTKAGLLAARERLASLATGYHAVLMALPDGTGKILRFRQDLDLGHLPAAPKSPTLRSLDLALLNAVVFRTVLGIAEPEAPGHSQIYAVPSLERLVSQVQDRVFQAGFALNPPPSWELRAVIEAGQSLPPRTLSVGPAPPKDLLFYSGE